MEDNSKSLADTVNTAFEKTRTSFKRLKKSAHIGTAYLKSAAKEMFTPRKGAYTAVSVAALEAATLAFLATRPSIVQANSISSELRRPVYDQSKCDWFGLNPGLLFEKTASEEANVRGVFTPENDKRGYFFARVEAECKYTLARIGIGYFEGAAHPDGKTRLLDPDAMELLLGLRYETGSFSTYGGFNFQKLRELQKVDSFVRNTELQLGGRLRMDPWFLDINLIHDPQGPDKFREGNLILAETGLTHKLWEGGEVGYGINADYLNKYFGGFNGIARTGVFAALKQDVTGGFYGIVSARYDMPNNGAAPSDMVLDNQNRLYLLFRIGWGNDKIHKTKTVPK